MDHSEATSAAGSVVTVERRRPVLVIKHSRGRLGGSAQLLAIVQRARWQGREVVVIDGDESSKTLRSYYPDGQGAALVPNGSDSVAFKDLMLSQLSLMVSDRLSRVVDMSGGSKDMDEAMAELNLSEFCQDYEIELISISMLGPDLEDLLHVIRATEIGSLSPKDMLLVMNHGVLRGGNPDAAFLPILHDERFKKLRQDGARAILMPRLPVMSSMRDALANLYEVASGRRPDGSIHNPIWQHMSKRFLAELEDEYVAAGIAGVLP